MTQAEPATATTKPYKYQWLAQYEISPGFIPPDTFADEAKFSFLKANVDPDSLGLVTVPGFANYCAPMIRTDGENLGEVAAHAAASFRGLIADIWTQLLVSKRDQKEKELYLLWDSDIPIPTEETALAWLLTCESWPMPRHREPVAKDVNGGQPGQPQPEQPGRSLVESLFPSQTITLPQSSPLSAASTQPVGYARGHNAESPRMLSGLFASSLNREDRERMAEIEFRPTPIYRPRTNNFTCYELHCNGMDSDKEFHIAHRWADRGAWPRNPTMAFDQNLGAWDLQESDYHLLALDNLRTSVMRNVISTPGIPTCRDTLYQPAGMHIRAWSQQHLAVKNIDPLAWSPEHDKIQLGSGGYLNTIPLAAPRVWFGFTRTGERLTSELSETLAPPTSAESWVHAYFKHRATALNQLFYPERIELTQIVEDATSARAKRLSRAGRIKKSGEVSQDAMANIFGALIKKDSE